MKKILFFLAISCSNCLASSDIYNCEIKHFYQSTVKGGLQEEEKSLYKSGDKFSVNRRNGEVHGYPFENIAWPEAIVISKGDENSSYKQINISNGPFKHHMVLNVKEWSKSNEKEFVGMDDDLVITGLCQ